jgi:quercetin 2,3-dioxygenase
MSLEPAAGKACKSIGANDLMFAAYPNRDANLGSLRISRAMPIRDRHMVGPWCFLDRYGPIIFQDGKPMNVPPHPHIGLQTVSWLLAGEVLHTDSLGNEAVGHPGSVNVMTAGKGIAHAEETPYQNSGHLNGVQLWVALPDTHRNVDPSFTSVDRVPSIDAPSGVLQIFAGSYDGLISPATFFSQIIGLDIQIHPNQSLELELSPEFEHAALVLQRDCQFENQLLEERMLYYLGSRRDRATFSSQLGGRLLLIGGLPFSETILMWWNFVARPPEEIAQARADWEAHQRFGDVLGKHGPRLEAPNLVRFARPNPAS